MQAAWDPQLVLNVQKIERNPLQHSFQNALVCSYEIPKKFQKQAAHVLEGMQFIDAGRQARIFIVARSHDLRSSLIEKLEGARLSLDFATTVKSIVETPRSYQPDVILVEDVFLKSESKNLFATLLGELSDDIPVLIMGSVEDEIMDQLVEDHPDQKLSVHDFIPQNFEEMLFADFIDVSQLQEEDGRVNLIPQDESSYAELEITAVLSYIHPYTVGVRLPCEFTKGVLLGLEHKIFSQRVFLKCMDRHKSKNSNPKRPESETTMFLTNFGTRERQKVAALAGMPQTGVVPSSSSGRITTQPQGELENAGLPDYIDPQVTLPALPKKPREIIELRQTSEVLSEMAQVGGRNFKAFLLSRNTRIIAMYVSFIVVTIYFGLILVPYIAERFAEDGGMYTEKIREYAGEIVPRPEEEE